MAASYFYPHTKRNIKILAPSRNNGFDGKLTNPLYTFNLTKKKNNHQITSEEFKVDRFVYRHRGK